jgi:ankyrin repeat protein
VAKPPLFGLTISRDGGSLIWNGAPMNLQRIFFRQFNLQPGVRGWLLRPLLLAVLVAAMAGCSRQTAMYHAAEQGDAARIKALLQTEPALASSQNPKTGITVLCAAAFAGHQDAVELLLASGADINGRSKAGETTLNLLAAAGNQDMVKFFLAHGADVSALDANGETALHMAAMGGHPEVAQLLLASRADINARDAAGDTPLHTAEVCNQPAVAAILRQHGGKD